MDFKDCEQHACSEVRAANLSADCTLMQVWELGVGMCGIAAQVLPAASSFLLSPPSLLIRNAFVEALPL
eukprot:366567-Chlamydomonas_euryale.AAC.3